jgi:uncharacterized membrane protein YraQ (UPF0718 family)
VLIAVALNNNATMSAIAGNGPMLICAAAPETPINTTFAATGMPMLIALEFAIFLPLFTLKETLLVRGNQICR